MSTPFDRDYFENGEKTGVSLYSDYRWLPDLTLPLASSIVEQLGIRRSEHILDYGCSKGFLVRALRLLGYEAYGFDVSEYAIGCAPEDVRPYVSTTFSPRPGQYDWIVAKDVLEHVDMDALPRTLCGLRDAARNVFVVVPLGDGKRYNYAEYERDATHVVRESLAWWSSTFGVVGFDVVSATTRMPRIKDRCPHPEGNGFFVLRSSR